MKDYYLVYVTLDVNNAALVVCGVVVTGAPSSEAVREMFSKVMNGPRSEIMAIEECRGVGPYPRVSYRKIE